MNILYIFSISIIISGSLYPVFALDTPQVCDANSLPHYGPHNPSHIYIKDTSGNLPYIPLTDHTAILHDDDVWNTYPEPRTIQVTLTIHNQDTGQLVFNQTQSLQMQACSGPESVKWRFVPIQVANYIATISDDRDKENMIFNSMLDATKSQTVSSPLEQLRFGIDLHSTVCKQDLQLVIKSEDNSPACVKPSTATILVGRGWALDQVLRTSEDVAINSSSSLQLSLSTNSSIVQSGQAIGITLSLDNVSPHLLTMNPQNNWPIQGLDSGGCSNSPMGVAILDGFYTVQNMSDGHPMVFHFLYPCPPSLSTKSFTFYPMSNNVTIICEPGDWAPCQNLMQTKTSVAYNKFLQDGKFFDFNSGNYTIIVGDEWGDVAIRHFQVVNSTQIHMEYDQLIVTQTYELHGEIKDIMPSTIFGKLASSSTGIAISRGGGLDTYDNDSIKLELNYGNASGSHVISATVQNLGKKTVHIYDIFISGFIPLANDDHLNFVVVRGDPYVVSKDDAILEPGESVTKYIVGNWTVDEKPVNGFSAGASYSYDDLQNFDGMTNGYSMSVPVQWVK